MAVPGHKHKAAVSAQAALETAVAAAALAATAGCPATTQTPARRQMHQTFLMAIYLHTT
jgi:hypothetical protein